MPHPAGPANPSVAATGCTSSAPAGRAERLACTFSRQPGDRTRRPVRWVARKSSHFRSMLRLIGLGPASNQQDPESSCRGSLPEVIKGSARCPCGASPAPFSLCRPPYRRVGHSPQPGRRFPWASRRPGPPFRAAAQQRHSVVEYAAALVHNQARRCGPGHERDRIPRARPETIPISFITQGASSVTPSYIFIVARWSVDDAALTTLSVAGPGGRAC